jgi:hypothetical protein
MTRFVGAEGATAPETLRPMDRGGMTLWKAAGVARRPTDGGNRCAAAGNLSGRATEGAPSAGRPRQAVRRVCG